MQAIPDLLAKRAELTPAKAAMEDLGQGRSITYAELDASASRAAGALAAMGLEAGDRAAVLCRNRLEFFELMFACARLGAVLAPLNWRCPAEELRPLLDLTGPKLLIHGAEDAACARELSDGSGLRTVDLDGAWPALAAAAEPQPGRGTWPSEEPWYLLFTSGTTGRPKAVINTYGMALANAINIGTGIGLTGADRTVNFLPLFHAGGIGLHTLPTLFAGGHVTILPGFDAEALLALIGAGRLDTVFGVPAVYLQLSQHPDFEAVDLTTVRHWGCGGAPLPDVLVRTFADKGALVCNGMGMTETGPTLFLMDQASVLAKIGSVGKPQLLARARIVDGQGRDVAPGETGELWFSGPGITPGYWRDEPATREAFSDCGWLKSGDLARRDEDGYVFVAGRSKEMFISGGENVYPAEVENVLVSHPDVIEAAVAAVPDPRWGEVGRGYIVTRPGARIDPETLQAFCRQRLAAYKTPKTFAFVPDLPRNALGKVVRHRLPELDGR
jgi:fatty-acyl-CoA synthase